MTSAPQKIAIIGGGISGLSLAYRLGKLTPHPTIELFEKSSSLRGTIQTEIRDGFVLEKGPDGFIQQKTTVRDLARELGIEQELIGTQSTNRRSMILQDNRLVEVPDGFYLMSPAKIFPFLKSPLLSWSGKLRTLCEIFIPAKKNDEEESLANFVRRRFGKENLEKISQAMLGGIYTADPEALSMQAALPRFVEMEKKYGSVMKGILATMASQGGVSGARYSLFGSFKNGMSTLVNTLAQNLTHTQIHLQCNVQSLTFEPSTKKWVLRTNDREVKFDHVALAIAPFQIAKFLTGLTLEEQKLLQSIHYASSAVFHFGFKEEQIQNKPSAVGFIVPNRENKHFIACSFVSDKYEHRAPQGYVLVRAFCGGALQEKHLDMDAHQLRNLVLQELRPILGIQGEPVLEDYAKWPQSMPQYTMGHIQRIESIRSTLSRFPNLHLLGNGYGGVGIPDLIDHAHQLVNQTMKY